MRKLFTFFSAIIISGSLSAQIPNAGFETWTNTGGYNIPTGWDNLNAKTASMSTYTCEKGTPGYAGSDYLQLTTRAVAGMGVIPGMAVCGVLDTATLQPISGFAFTSRPANLAGAWQYMASGSDQGHIIILLSKWNASGNMRDTVAYTNYALVGMAMSWATFSIPLTYMTGETPDSAIIVLTASRTVPVSGSYLYADSLSFTGTVPTGITSAANTPSVLSAYPNPATGTTTILYNSVSGSDIKIGVTDMSGKSIMTLTPKVVAGENRFPVNTSGFAKGMYLIKAIDGKNTQARKLVIE